MTLIFCTKCKSVFFKKFFNVFRYSKKDFYGVDAMPTIVKYLEENKSHLVWDWVDIEQTKEEYLKHCPMCKEVHYFEQVEN